jgi:hypothetical protein
VPLKQAHTPVCMTVIKFKYFCVSYLNYKNLSGSDQNIDIPPLLIVLSYSIIVCFVGVFEIKRMVQVEKF